MGAPLTAAAAITALTLVASDSWVPQTELDCHPYIEMLAQLKIRYGQVPLSGGALHDAAEQDSGGLVIVGTPRGDSWTLIVLTSDGRNACLGAWGRNWQQSLTGRRMPSNLPPDGKPVMD